MVSGFDVTRVWSPHYEVHKSGTITAVRAIHERFRILTDSILTVIAATSSKGLLLQRRQEKEDYGSFAFSSWPQSVARALSRSPLANHWRVGALVIRIMIS